MAQISLGVEIIEFCSANQAVNGSGTFTAAVRAREQVILAAQRDHAQGAFSGVIVNLDGTIVAIARERLIYAMTAFM